MHTTINLTNINYNVIKEGIDTSHRRIPDAHATRKIGAEGIETSIFSIRYFTLETMRYKHSNMERPLQQQH